MKSLSLTLTLATITLALPASIAAAESFWATPSVADVNNDGFVDSSDLISVTTKFGQACGDNCKTDLNRDQITTVSDFLILLQHFGQAEDSKPSNVSWSDQQYQFTTSAQSNQSIDQSWQNKPTVLLNAINYDQGPRPGGICGNTGWQDGPTFQLGEITQSWAAENNVGVQSMVYGSLDSNFDNQLTEVDKASFVLWLNDTIPGDYRGTICLTLKGKWWSMLDTSSQAAMDQVVDVYLGQLELAKALRPNAQIGFWGLPKKSHTDVDSPTASIERLLQASTAIFPEVYENKPKMNDAARLRTHIERAIEMAQGQKPVYVQTSPRYYSEFGEYQNYHEQASYMQDQVQSSLAAVWTDSNNVKHRVTGISLWDSYDYASMYTIGWSEMSPDQRKEVWNEFDLFHIELLSEMKSQVDDSNRAAQTQGIPPQSQTAASFSQEDTAVAAKPKLQKSRLVGSTSRSIVPDSHETLAKAARSLRKGNSEFIIILED